MARPQIELCHAAETALVLANDEAAHSGAGLVWPHHFVLGIVREGTGGGAVALKRLGLTVNDARAAARELLKPPRDEVITGTLPLHPFTRRAIRRAALIAAADGQTQVNDSHLLLALIENARRPATRLLIRLGVNPEYLRSLLTRAPIPGTAEVCYSAAPPDKSRHRRWWHFGGR